MCGTKLSPPFVQSLEEKRTVGIAHGLLRRLPQSGMGLAGPVVIQDQAAPGIAAGHPAGHHVHIILAVPAHQHRTPPAVEGRQIVPNDLRLAGTEGLGIRLSLRPLMVVLRQIAPPGVPREHAYAFTKLEWYLDETAPILASDRVGVYADGRLLEKSEDYIPSVPMLFVEDGDIQSEYKQEIPAGQYICMYYHDSGLEEYNPSFELIKDYLRVHDLEINGRIFQIYKIDVTLTSNPKEALMEIQVPVRSGDA